MHFLYPHREKFLNYRDWLIFYTYENLYTFSKIFFKFLMYFLDRCAVRVPLIFPINFIFKILHLYIHNGIPIIFFKLHLLLNFLFLFYIFREPNFIAFQKYLLFLFPNFYSRILKNFGDFLGYGWRHNYSTLRFFNDRIF